jgi:hypothetical protein
MPNEEKLAAACFEKMSAKRECIAGCFVRTDLKQFATSLPQNRKGSCDKDRSEHGNYRHDDQTIPHHRC